VTYCYDAESRLSSISCTNTQGRGFTLNYGYSGYNGTGFTLTTPTNAVIESILMRDQFRRHQVTDVATEFNGLEITIHSYAFDALGRTTNAIRNIQPLSLASTNVYAYNARSEVIGADIETNNYVYVYDGLGNNLYTSLNSITNAYTVNNLNQYKAVTNLMDFTGFRLGHDADGNTTLINGHYLLYDPENRLFAYIFGINNSTTGTLRSAYVYDYLGRRVKKMGQECREKDMGIGFFTYWHTNEVTTFVYDGWNLVHERLALTNGTTQEVSYFWGKDLSGSMQGAGGVGGLLAASIDGAFYFPCYDNNGNITAYIDEGGAVVAYRQYDAFGNTIAKGGAMIDVLHFWYSTKYLDHDTGLYYYGYRYYSPMLQRWINRDPIEEEGGLNLYGFCGNNSLNCFDYLGYVPDFATFWAEYKKYKYEYKSAEEIWDIIGGTVKAKMYEGVEKGKHPNTCAARVSLTLNGITGNEIPDDKREFVNTLKKHEKGSKGNFIVNAAKMGAYLKEKWGTKSECSDTAAYYFKSTASDFKTLKKEIKDIVEKKCCRKGFLAVVFSSSTLKGLSGHVGVVTDEYKDKNTPLTTDTEIWLLPPTKKKESKK
jgi:RHS repeat-associated protein